MSARPVTEAEFRKALDMHCIASGVTASEGEDHGQKRFLLSPGDIIVRLEEGRIISTSQSTYEKLNELIGDIRLSAIMDTEEPNPNPSTPTQPAPAPEPTAPIQSDGSNLTKLLDLFDSDVLEIFGDTGVGKTIFCQAVAEEAAKAGRRVIYIDTEKNVGRKAKARLSALKGYKELRFNPSDGIKSQVTGPGFYYLYTPSLQELSTITKNLPVADLVIIDSLGMPVLVKYSRMKQNEQGHVLQEMIAIKGDLKEWAYRSGGLAIDVNQPVSDMNKTPSQIKEGLWPFGDKSGFATKSVLRFWKVKDQEGSTVIEGKINKSRDFGRGTKVIDMEITGAGAAIKIIEAA